MPGDNSDLHYPRKVCGVWFFPFLPLLYRNVAVKIMVSGLRDYTILLSIGEVVLWVFFLLVGY